MVWQNFRENQHLSDCLNQKDIQSFYLAREIFVAMQSQEEMTSIIEGKKTDVQNSNYLTNQVFKKTYIQIKRSIDDWLRLKNLRTNLCEKELMDNQQLTSARDLISIQELIQYKLQYKSFTKNQIRYLKRPKDFPSKKENKAQMTAHYQYSSVDFKYAQDGRLSFGVVPAQERTISCLYEIENSRQILVITGRNQHELRMVIESFLQANLKIRTKYKCCVLHHCTEENSISCDSYFIVRNIMRQILRTLPFVRDYLMISGGTTNEFTQVIKEIMGGNDKEDYLKQSNYPQIFVKFVKRINEMKLDFNIVVAITGIEFAFKQDDFSNIVYLLRSASVYLHTNSFLKFLVTAVTPPIPQTTGEDLFGHLCNDKLFATHVLLPEENRYQSILKILQTGAVCNVEDAMYFGKNGQELAEFALDYLFQCKDKGLAESLLAKANNSYQKLVEIISQLVMVQELDSAKFVINDFKTEEVRYSDALGKLVNTYGFESAITIVLGLIEMVRFGENFIHLNQLQRYIEVQNLYIASTDSSSFFALKDQFSEQKPTVPIELHAVLDLLSPMLVSSNCSKINGFNQEYNCSLQPQKSEVKEYLDGLWMTLEAKGVSIRDIRLFKECIVQLLFKIVKKEKLESLKLGIYGYYHHLSWLASCQVMQSYPQNLDWVLYTMMTLSPSDKNFDHLRRVHSLDIIAIFNSQIRLNQLNGKADITALSFGEGFFEFLNEKHTLKLILLLRPDFIYFMVKYVYKSFWRFINKLKDYARSFGCFEVNSKQYGNMELLFDFINILTSIETTLQDQEFTYPDFLAQFRCRILKEQTYLTLLEQGSDQDLDTYLQKCSGSLGNKLYFEGFHHSLRENKRLEMIVKMPGCLVLSIKFFSKNEIFISMSNGMIVMYDTEKHQVVKIFPNKGAIIDCLKILNKNFLLTAGIDSKTRMWSIKTEKLLAKFEIHKYATHQILVHDTNMYSYGGPDLKLAKLDITTKEIDCWINLKSHITALKLIKFTEKDKESRIAAAFHDFDVVLYDLDLNQLVQITISNMIPGDEVIKIIRTGQSEIMCFSIEGTINVLGCNHLEDIKTCSLFNLKNEDFIDMLLIKSREQIIFTIESQKIEFYSTASFKRTDSWDFFIQNNIVCCHKNKEGSKILIADKSQNLIMFNFIKILDTAKERQVPSNRKYDPVVSIDITKSTKRKDHQIISCSHDRDLRIWDKNDGVFVKKYDLSSFLADNVQCIKLGKNEDNLFLGSKDMNVYLINISKGKLCVVYEGHWNRVTSIYSVPETDILVTISESNIKIWDLEYDECIKNMNDHSSMIVYIEQLETDDQQVMTIGDQFELKVWNYVTGEISRQFKIDLGKDQKDMKKMQILCCDVLKDLAYIAINNGEILVYYIYEAKTQIVFQSWQGEEVIYLKGVKTYENNFLIAVYRSSAVLYQVHADQVEKICSYTLNSKKKPSYKQSNQFSSHLRFYFTSAQVQLLYEQQIIQKYADLQKKLENISASDPILRCIKNMKQKQISTVEELIQDYKEEEIVFENQESPSELHEVSQANLTGTEMSYNLIGMESKKIKNKQLQIDFRSNSLFASEQEQLSMTIINRLNDKKVRRREQQFKMQKDSIQQKGVKCIKGGLNTINSLNDEFSMLINYLQGVEAQLPSGEDEVKSYLKSQKAAFMSHLMRALDPECGDLKYAFKVLICLGDSKGQIHMNHIYLF